MTEQGPFDTDCILHLNQILACTNLPSIALDATLAECRFPLVRLGMFLRVDLPEFVAAITGLEPTFTEACAGYGMVEYLGEFPRLLALIIDTPTARDGADSRVPTARDQAIAAFQDWFQAAEVAVRSTGYYDPSRNHEPLPGKELDALEVQTNLQADAAKYEQEMEEISRHAYRFINGRLVRDDHEWYHLGEEEED